MEKVFVARFRELCLSLTCFSILPIPLNIRFCLITIALSIGVLFFIIFLIDFVPLILSFLMLLLIYIDSTIIKKTLWPVLFYV